MDWVAKGFQPGFPELIIQHLGAVKAEKVLKTFAFAKIFSLVKLQSLAPSGDATTVKRKVMTVIQSISTRYRLPTPLEEVVNSIMNIWAVTRFSNLIPRQPYPVKAAPRTLTLREAAVVGHSPQPLFIKTAIRLPTPVGPQLPSFPDSPNPKATSSPRQDYPSSQSSNLTMDSFSQPSKPTYIPRKVSYNQPPQENGRLRPNRP